MKEIIVSGIQPSGDMHVGNYLGALKDFVELQDKFQCYFFIADYHSISEDFDPKQKREQIFNLAATFLAVGLDPKKSTIFVQSHIPAHTELAWILNTVTPVGELERMTQYKDKALRQKANINAGLFNYPVLMAADILIYKPDFVPVGHDQVQHLEITNTIGRKFNNHYGQTFKEIKPYTKQPLRVMSLSNPERKMSKSEPDSVLNIFDSPDAIKKKIAKAVTATDAPGQMPKGVKNLFDLLKQFGDKATVKQFEDEYKNNTIKYSELKSALAQAIIDYFAPMREKYLALKENPDQLHKILKSGAATAGQEALKTLAEVKQKIGLI